jgi:hypothetical protein
MSAGVSGIWRARLALISDESSRTFLRTESRTWRRTSADSRRAAAALSLALPPTPIVTLVCARITAVKRAYMYGSLKLVD